MSQQRWFDNPYLDYNDKPGEGATEVFAGDNKDKLRRQGLELLDLAFAHGIRDCDGGLYVGAIGIAYAYLHVYHVLTPDERKKYLKLANSALQSQEGFYTTHKTPEKEGCALLLGKGGYFVVGSVLARDKGNEMLFKECIINYVQAAHVCKPINFFKHGSDELFVGRTGYLCGALWMQKKLGYMPIDKKDLMDVWSAIITSGQKYAENHKSPAPLMYAYYDTEYLGAAHGVSAIMQTLLCFPTFLAERPDAEKLIKDTVDYYLTLQDRNGNFPCAMDEIGPRARAENDLLVHFCHGAPGAVYMFAKAYLHFKDQAYLDACLKCGDVVWSKGLLRKGPGICHGIAGNGYVFLLLYNLLKQADPKHLYRAVKFAEFLSDSQFVKEARRPDSPYSLYEGVAGTACYLMDLMQPEKAEFPFFSMNNDYVPP